MLSIAAALLSVALGATPYTIVLGDGRAFQTREAPDIHDGMLVAHLDDGTLVSLPQDHVDWQATLVANRQAREAAERKRAEAAARSASGRRHHGVITNETLEAYRRENPPGGAPATHPEPRPARPHPAAVTVESERAPRYVESGEAVDKYGRDRLYWAERAREVRDRVRRAEIGLEAAARAYDAEQDALLHGRVVSSRQSPLSVIQFIQSPEERGAAFFRLSQLEERLIDAEAILAEALAEERDLATEARRSRAEPGWIRFPQAY